VATEQFDATPVTSVASPGSRRERREREGSSPEPTLRPATGSPKETSGPSSQRLSGLFTGIRSNTATILGRIPTARIPRPTRRGVASTVVMTLAAGLVATAALPAYAFGNGAGNFAAITTASAVGASQTLSVGAAAAALAVSRDNYVAPSLEQLAASKAAEAAATAATAAAASAASAKTSTGVFAVNPPSGAYSGAAIVAFAEQFVGNVPYGSGASPDTSFGCDGLTQYVFGAFGIYLPRIVSNQAAMGIRIAPADAQAGDLVVWPIGHIGIYDGNGGEIDSPTWGRSVEHRALWGSYYFVRIV
jgi:cell wall-associated NlpC family hydrolase